MCTYIKALKNPQKHKFQASTERKPKVQNTVILNKSGGRQTNEMKSSDTKKNNAFTACRTKSCEKRRVSYPKQLHRYIDST